MIQINNCTLEELWRIGKAKRLFCFGSGMQIQWLSSERIGFEFINVIEAIIDNDQTKAGTFREIDGTKIPIISYKDFLLQKDENTIVLLTSMYFVEMIRQMDQEQLLEGMTCYVDVFLKEKYPYQPITLTKKDEISIPKVIHYCWFGNNPMPASVQKCIDSWKRFCPDYKIIKYDESNYDVTKNNYMKQAYEKGKWAFVSDYARIDIIHQYGGVYLDTDVEIIKSFDDLLFDQMFCGFEQGNVINFGLGFGAEKKHNILKELLFVYEKLEFIQADGSLNLTPCTIYQTDILKKYGLKQNGRYQRLEDIVVYPRELFSPQSFYGLSECFSEYTHSIHHYDASWFEETQSKVKILKENKKILDRMNMLLK